MKGLPFLRNNIYKDYHLMIFQAEDGIRDRDVTGVQTCALPISITVWPIFRELYHVLQPWH